jgi:ribosomal protein S18 acetylase RimI-like enzyme
MHALELRYYKRFQMEIDLRRWVRPALSVCPGYRLICWSPELVQEHAEAKYLSFRDELDSVVFPCLGDLESCIRLMYEICERDGFVPEATWLAEYAAPGSRRRESCGTIQAIRTHRNRANIQNIGVTPQHRGRGVGAALIVASLHGLQQVGVSRVGLEVTAENDSAVRLYRRLGFRVVKTVYKSSDQASQDAKALAH